MSTTVERLVELRQSAHVRALDAAYVDGYSSVRAAAGQDLTQTNLLADSYGTYTALRKALLREKLEAVQAIKASTGSYNNGNRFALPTCGNLEAPVTQSAVLSALPSAQPPPQQLSYMAWRRTILARRFEKRRAALEEECIRRKAAEAVQRAMEAEAAAREEFGQIKEEREAALRGQRHDAAPARQEMVWRVKHSMSTFEEVSDPAVMQAMMALGLGGKRRGSRAGTGGSNSSSSLYTDQHHLALARRLFGDVADRVGTRSVTAMAFLPEDPDTFAIATDAGVVYLCSASHGLMWATLTGHEGAVTGLDWAASEGNLFLVTVSADKTARVWFVTLPTIEVPQPIDIQPPPPQQPTQRNDNSANDGPHQSPDASAAAATASSRPADSKAGDASAVAREMAAAKAQMEFEAAKAREAEWLARGPVALGGSAACVQVIQTDCPLTSVSFFPLNPSLFVAAAMEESDYDALLEAQAISKGLAAGAGHAGIPRSGTMDEGHMDTGGGRPGGGSSDQHEHHSQQHQQQDGAQASNTTTSSASSNAVKQVGAALGSVFKKGMDLNMAVLKGAVNVVAKTGQAALNVASILPGAQLLARRRARARGYLLVFDAVNGRVLQSRLVQGNVVNPTTLQRPVSYPTAMTFSLDGTQLYVADGRGMVHSYDVETDERAIEGSGNALGEHNVLYGESSALMSGLRKLGDQMKAGLGSLAVDGSDGGATTPAVAPSHGQADGQTSAGAGESGEAESPSVYFTSLYCKKDHTLNNAPLLVGLDSNNKIRALTIPQTGGGPLGLGHQLRDLAAPDDDVARAALMAVGATTKATAMLMKTAVAVGTLGAVQVQGLGQRQSTELDNYIAYSAHYNQVVGGGGTFGAATGTGTTAQAHVTMAPIYSDDSLVAANAAGDVFVLQPHPPEGESGGRRGRSGSSYFGGSLSSLAGAAATVGSGVSSSQVAAKLAGHTKPVASIAVAPRERFIATADEGGAVLIWERVPASQALAEEQSKQAEVNARQQQAEASMRSRRARSVSRGANPQSGKPSDRGASAPPSQRR